MFCWAPKFIWRSSFLSKSIKLNVAVTYNIHYNKILMTPLAKMRQKNGMIQNRLSKRNWWSTRKLWQTSNDLDNYWELRECYKRVLRLTIFKLDTTCINCVMFQKCLFVSPLWNWCNILIYPFSKYPKTWGVAGGGGCWATFNISWGNLFEKSKNT